MPARLLALVLLFCLAALPAGARQSAPVQSDNITARIVTDHAALTPGETVTLAFVQEIREGWHTYWLNPGDSGAPANLHWDLPDGTVLGEAEWPAPEAIPYFGLMTYGHHDRFVVLHELTLPDDWPAGAPFPIRLEADWLVCAEICIPEDGSFALDLPTGPASSPADGDIRGLIEEARAALPRPNPWAVRFNQSDDTLRLEASLEATLEGLVDARFFPLTQGLIDQVADQPWRNGAEGFVLDMDLAWPEGLTAPLEGVLVLTEDLPDGQLRQAFVVEADRDSTLAMGRLATGGLSGLVPSGLVSGSTAPGLLELAFLALLGGILLNLMPCVFPVLSIKALSLVQHAGSPRAIAHGLAYTGGVLMTFMALAGLLIALQAGGALIGWGFQLQEPLVVAFLAYLMFVIGLWLIGGLMDGLEHGMARLMGLGQGLGQGSGRKDGLGGSFMTGVLAVFVASPCTAPFMAGAIGFAMTRDPATALAVFAALGLGLALPYLALSVSPWAQRRLPRPGAWMVRFRQFMAFPMFATAAWLVWVLAQQAGDRALLLVLMGFVAIALAIWAFRQDGRIAKGAGIACLALALGLGVLPGQLPAAGPANDTAPGGYRISFDGPAEPFAEARLAELRAAGRPVFVNMTAAWCLTCLVNEGNALSGQMFEETLARNDAAYLKGDWTRRDPVITSYLRSFERSGVPLYVVYPAKGEPVLLPQLLTEGMVRDALDRAGSSRLDNRTSS